jgi:hypothetical protein
MTREERKMMMEMAKEILKGKNTKKLSHYDRTKAEVYASGNKWAIENWEATH